MLGCGNQKAEGVYSESCRKIRRKWNPSLKKKKKAYGTCSYLGNHSPQALLDTTVYSSGLPYPVWVTGKNIIC